MTGIDCRIVSGDHSAESPLIPYILGETTNTKRVRLGVNVRLGVGVSVIGNVSIGHGSIIGAGALVTRDIPPFSIAFGIPCRVQQRYDFTVNKWIAADTFDTQRENLMPSEEEYLRLLQSSHPKILMPLQALSHRFGDML